MNWKKALGFGVLIWIVMFIVICILIAYKLIESNQMPMAYSVALAVLSLIIAYFAARNLAPMSYAVAIQYGLIFAVVGIVLDFIISARFAPDMFSSVIYWVSYVLIVLVPLLVVKKVPNQNPQG